MSTAGSTSTAVGRPVDGASAPPLADDNISTLTIPAEAAIDEPAVSSAALRQRLMGQIGTLRLTKGQRAKLTAPTSPDIANIKPTGEVYIPGVHYRKVLNDAFGSGAWGLRPLSAIQLDLRAKGDGGRSIMYREYLLVVTGTAVSAVIGEAEYHPTNSRLTWADAAEALRTNALSRACKDLGVFADAWDPMWTTRWRQAHAVQVWLDKKKRDDGDSKPQWRRLDAEPLLFEDRPTAESPNVAEYWRRRGVKAPPDGREPAREAAPEPARPTTTEAPRPATQPAAEPRELVTTARERKGQDGAVFFEIKTTGRTYFTESRELYDGAVAASRAQRPMVMVAEERTGARGAFWWLTEMHA